jgi:hypothetical protein
MREAYTSGKKIGYELGTHDSSPAKQMGRIIDTVTNESDKKFYDRLIELCKEYNARISYHPLKGMVITRLIE